MWLPPITGRTPVSRWNPATPSARCGTASTTWSIMAVLSDALVLALAPTAGPWSLYGTHLTRSARDHQAPRGPLAGRRPHIRSCRAPTWQPIVRSMAQVLLTLPRDRAISSVVAEG